MGQLRDKMEADLKLKGFSDNTRESYLRCAGLFARHFNVSPMKMGAEEVRDFLLHLRDKKNASAATLNVYSAALRFLYGQTLGRPVGCGEDSLVQEDKTGASNSQWR